MKKIIPALMFGILAFVLMLAACGPLKQPPTTAAEATALSSALTVLPGGTAIVITAIPDTSTTPAAGTPAAAGTVQAPAITQIPSQIAQVPITGDINQTQVVCQFCVDGLAHALVALPAGATFQMIPPGTGSMPANTNCTPVEQVNGRSVLLCTGGPAYTLQIRICLGDKCYEVPVKLMSCPGTQAQPNKPPAAQPATPTAIMPTQPPATIVPTQPPATLPPTEPPAPTPTPPAPTTEPASPTPGAGIVPTILTLIP